MEGGEEEGMAIRCNNEEKRRRKLDEVDTRLGRGNNGEGREIRKGEEKKEEAGNGRGRRKDEEKELQL